MGGGWGELQQGITSEWPSSKSLQTNAEEGMDKREHAYPAGGNVNWHSHNGEQYEGSLKTNTTVTI